MECPRCRLLSPDGAQRCDCGYDFASGEMRASYSKAADLQTRATSAERAPHGIGGWLLLPAVGLIVSIPAVLLEASRSLRSGDAGEVAVVAATMVVVAITAVAFFQKRRWAPRVFIVLLSLDAVLAAVPVILARDPVAAADSRDLARATLSALIWIPYFLVSRRVKSTFTE